MLLAVAALALDADRDPTIGRSYRVPYRSTDTNHALVRVRINGVGPFNFLVDTGAPALYVGTAAAKRDRPGSLEGRLLDRRRSPRLRGGPTLSKVQGRVEDPSSSSP